MSRIFLTLASISNVLLVVTFVLGWQIGDPASLEELEQNQVGTHFLVAMGAAMIALMVHAIALTYFMGTGRWIEETCEAYRLGNSARDENIRLKYRVIPGMVIMMLLIMATGSFGAITDPASHYRIPWSRLAHFTLACATLVGNLLVSCLEWNQIVRNGKVVEAVIAEVRRIRKEKGLDD